MWDLPSFVDCSVALAHPSVCSDATACSGCGLRKSLVYFEFISWHSYCHHSEEII